jgi:serine-type D-Ala-D-Ala endopeptidase (penicillin-binding protein 7)
VKNVASILGLILILGSPAAVWAESAKASRQDKASNAKATSKKPSKRVAVSYKKKYGGKSVTSAAAASAAGAAPDVDAEALPDIKSTAVLVQDMQAGTTLFAKNTSQVSPIASITKLMTAMIVLDAEQPLEESVRIEKGDIDTIKHTGSRLRIGSSFSRRDLLHMALMSSENRAASALGRNYPGGMRAFVARMNAKALELGMLNTRFAEPTGLSSENVSTADELALLVQASLDYPLIRSFTTTASAQIHTADSGHTYGFLNSNGLVRGSDWQIDVSKTGYIAEAGQCLVMRARIRERPVIIVLLDSWGKYTRIGDANRIRRWLERNALLADGPS